VGYRVVRADELGWEERPPIAGGAPRHAADLTPQAALAQSRARMWRIPPGARGRRHSEQAQEEVFVVLAGTLTLLLGDPPERFDLPPQSVASVEPGTAIQMRNEGDVDVVVFAYGAPPVAGQAEYLDDVELA
jgi:mannose-6-phosphate isomerase-like protein (cupin superfamily)